MLLSTSSPQTRATGWHWLLSQSDFWTFSSDQNMTITAMSTAEGFTGTCRETITAMIDPEGVILSEPITSSSLNIVQLRVTRHVSVNIQTASIFGNAAQLLGHCNRKALLNAVHQSAVHQLRLNQSLD